MAEKTIFEKIIDREIPADIVYEDEQVLAFRDISPKAPVHVLVITKKPLTSLQAMDETDISLLGHLMHVVTRIAAQEEMEDGYRVVTNIGADGGQEVPHLHFHILGKRKMTWPPG